MRNNLVFKRAPDNQKRMIKDIFRVREKDILYHKRRKSAEYIAGVLLLL